ncbi:Conserved_hypothetical protein [Hexamita inflata]|uniref:Uncharacterized protein n=1 Tax=Hexamita inflata TaxID=28002 RepID=A0AA86UWH9_9EUKA|nr:Conserved hypothetical protein [Hexamita inflata]
MNFNFNNKPANTGFGGAAPTGFGANAPAAGGFGANNAPISNAFGNNAPNTGAGAGGFNAGTNTGTGTGATGFNTGAGAGFNAGAGAGAGGFGGGFKTGGFGATGGGFGAGAAAKPQNSLQLSDIGAELIDASIQFNNSLRPKQQSTVFESVYIDPKPVMYGASSGFHTQSVQQSVLTQSKSNRDILHQSLIKKMSSQHQQPSVVQTVVAPQLSGTRLTYRNMFGQIEFLDFLTVPSGFRLEDHVEIKHGFVGLKSIENCPELVGKKARIQLFNVYPENGESALKQQTAFLQGTYESYIDGTWQFVIDMV